MFNGGSLSFASCVQCTTKDNRLDIQVESAKASISNFHLEGLDVSGAQQPET